jgi:hypothetical protein
MDAPSSVPQGTGIQSPSRGLAGARGINPLVRVATNEDIQAAEQPPPIDQTPEVDSHLAGHIRRAWNTNKLFKEKVSLRLLKCLRARRGLYSPSEIAQMQQVGGLNFVWVDLTETKCRAASAWIREVLMPIGERPWMLEPSPLPDLPPEQDAQILEKAAAEARKVMEDIFQSGAGVLSPDEFRALAMEMKEQLADDVTMRVEKEARKRADRMSKKLADEMDQGRWEHAMDGFVEDFVTYPTAILKGPFWQRRKHLTWLPGYKPGVSNAMRQTWSRVDPFDAYPAPYAKSCQDGDFIERTRFLRKELFDCIGMPGFNEQKLREALNAYYNGHLEGWLWTEAERQRLQQDTLYTWLSPAGIIDALHYWGSVPGWKLMDWGVEHFESLDPQREYEVEAIIIGPYVVYCSLNHDPLGRRPYWHASYDAVPGAFWGRSIPDLAESCQKMANAAACALADNLGMASGPMIWTHIDRLADGENPNDIYPWRVFQLKSQADQGVNPGIGSIDFNPHIAEMQAVIEKWEIRCDDATGIPRYTYGNERVGGAANTYSGLSMLMNNAAKGLRRAIGNVDTNVIQETVYSAYVNEMIYGKDNLLKGDCFVSPKGAAAILVKEAQTQSRLQALQITSQTPEDMQLLGPKVRLQLYKEVFKALDIGTDNFPTEDELEERMAAMQEAQAQQAQAMQQAEDGKVQAQMAIKGKEIDSRERIAGAQIGAKLADRGKEPAGSTPMPGQGFKRDLAGNPKQPGQKAEIEPGGLADDGDREPARSAAPAAKAPDNGLEKKVDDLAKRLDAERDSKMERQLAEMQRQIQRQIDVLANTPPKQREREQPPVINVTVDAKTGKVKKQFTMKKTKAGAYEGTVTETESE